MKPAILIVDDSKPARQQMLSILKERGLFQGFHEASNVIEGFKLALETPLDVILCDLEMPSMDGFKFLSMVKTRPEISDLPIILVTGREDQESKIRGLEMGASDYVTKPFDPGELVARVKVQLKIKSLQDSLKESNQALLELSNTDPLTQLYNRRYLMECLDREIKRSVRSGSLVSLLMIDIDHFKRINDTYGHQQGDEVLKSLASLMTEHLRDYDVAARFGGEEFALVLPETELEGAAQVGERIREAIGALSFPDLPQKLRITTSLGLAAYPLTGITNVDDLIREADHALYEAKRTGRNRLVITGKQ